MTDVPQDNLASLSTAAPVAEAPRPRTKSAPAHGAGDGAKLWGGRTFTVTFLGTFGLLYAAILVVNWLGNGTGLFPSKINPCVSERAWKSRRIEYTVRHHRAPKVIVLGSSRMMQIQPPYLEAVAGKGPAFNYAVSAAGPVEWLTQLRWLVASGAKPDMIILGVDDFCFGTQFNRFQLQLGGHWSLFQQIPLIERAITARDILLQVNWDTTRDSLKILRSPPKQRQRSMKRADHFSTADGYLVYKDHVMTRVPQVTIPREAGFAYVPPIAPGVWIAADLMALRARCETKFALGARVRRQAAAWRGNLEKEPDPLGALSPSPRKVAMFQEFLDLAKANGIEVKVLMPPLHPSYEKRALTPAMQAIRDQVSKMVAEMCAQRQFTYRDFRSLKSYGAKPEAFWDALHQTPENTRRMVNVLFGLPPEKIVKEVASDPEIIAKPPKVTDLNTW